MIEKFQCLIPIFFSRLTDPADAPRGEWQPTNLEHCGSAFIPIVCIRFSLLLVLELALVSKRAGLAAPPGVGGWRWACGSRRKRSWSPTYFHRGMNGSVPWGGQHEIHSEASQHVPLMAPVRHMAESTLQASIRHWETNWFMIMNYSSGLKFFLYQASMLFEVVLLKV